MQVSTLSMPSVARITHEPSRAAPGRPLARLCAWLVTGYVGASLVAISALQWLNGDADIDHALALAIIGGAATTLAWQRAHRLIAAIEPIRPSQAVSAATATTAASR